MAVKKDPGNTATKKYDDFSNWYNDLVERSELSDKRYPIKGMNVWRPYGWKAMSLIDNLTRKLMDEKGHGEVCFPLLVPQTEFQKEADHVKGFDAEVYWVKHAGLNELDVPLLLRPTSETAMYPVFALWVRSHADLPLKTYQIVNTFRYDTKMTRPFIRVREIHFFEAHTCHADEAGAEANIDDDLGILASLCRDLCLPYLLSRRPEWDKFPGAHYTLGADTFMPNGKTVQIATIHQYLENFSRPYEVKYEDDSGEWRHVPQTTFGMSERLLGAVVALHGDDKGLILPPAIAPFQMVIVPILAKKTAEEVTTTARELAGRLKTGGFRVHLDERDRRPGEKYYHWEERGVPLRIELGPRDIAAGVVMLARRDTGEKCTVPDDEYLNKKLNETLDSIAANMLERATDDLRESLARVRDVRDEPPAHKVLYFGWCGDTDCADEIEREWDVKFLGVCEKRDKVAIEALGLSPVDAEPGPCIRCGRPRIHLTFASKQM